MWGKIMIPMYRLWLHSLYGLYGPRYPLSPERPLNLITHSLTPPPLWGYYCYCTTWHKTLIFVYEKHDKRSSYLTHWGRETHIWVSKLTIIGSDNDLSPGRRQAIIWTNAVILLIAPLGTNFSEIVIEIYTFSFMKMHLKMSSGKWWPFLSASMC